MADIEKFQTKYADCLRKVVPEPIERVAFFGRAGHIASDALYFASPLAAAIKRRSDAAGAPGVPHRMIAALTATSIYLVDYRPKGFGIKPKGDAVVWRRDQVCFTAPQGAGTGALVIVDFVSGDRVELENEALAGFKGEFNTEFLARVAVPAIPVAPAAVVAPAAS